MFADDEAAVSGDEMSGDEDDELASDVDSNGDLRDFIADEEEEEEEECPKKKRKRDKEEARRKKEEDCLSEILNQIRDEIDSGNSVKAWLNEIEPRVKALWCPDLTDCFNELRNLSRKRRRTRQLSETPEDKGSPKSPSKRSPKRSPKSSPKVPPKSSPKSSPKVPPKSSPKVPPKRSPKSRPKAKSPPKGKRSPKAKSPSPIKSPPCLAGSPLRGGRPLAPALSPPLFSSRRKLLVNTKWESKVGEFVAVDKPKEEAVSSAARWGLCLGKKEPKVSKGASNPRDGYAFRNSVLVRIDKGVAKPSNGVDEK